MRIAQLLVAVNKAFPPAHGAIAPDVWQRNTLALCEQLSLVAERFTHSLELSAPRRLLADSKQELLYPPNPRAVTADFRLRPKNFYYETTGQAIPRPENEVGLDATGLQLSLMLCRGYHTQNGLHPACFTVHFQIWGARERRCFGMLLRDHRHAIAALLRIPRASFFTPCEFENVDRAPQLDVFDKLDLYFENTVDDENSFSIEVEFFNARADEQALSAVLRLAAIYDCTYGYCLPARDEQRVYNYVPLIAREA